jgi:hypothetical protein
MRSSGHCASRRRRQARWRPRNCGSDTICVCHALTFNRFPTRDQVSRANAARLKRLSGTPVTFRAVDSGSGIANQETRAWRQSQLDDMVDPSLVLKKGAQVMLVKNLDERLVNGVCGTVLDFVSELELA